MLKWCVACIVYCSNCCCHIGQKRLILRKFSGMHQLLSFGVGGSMWWVEAKRIVMNPDWSIGALLSRMARHWRMSGKLKYPYHVVDLIGMSQWTCVICMQSPWGHACLRGDCWYLVLRHMLFILCSGTDVLLVVYNYTFCKWTILCNFWLPTFCRACVVANDKLFVIGGQEGDFMPKPGSPIFKCVRRHEVCMWFLVPLIHAPVVYFLVIKTCIGPCWVVLMKTWYL
jgi:hypothetical protein